MDTHARRVRALMALRAVKLAGKTDCTEDAFVELLTDLRHLAEGRVFDIDKLIYRSLLRYRAEQE